MKKAKAGNGLVWVCSKCGKLYDAGKSRCPECGLPRKRIR